MSNQAIIFLLLGVVIAILAVINAFLLWYFNQTNKKIDTLLENGKIKDFKDIFLAQKDRMAGLDEKIEEAFLKIKNLQEISEKTIQKTSVVRFNPFGDMGGNQSFIIALLDNKNTGFVISSLFVKDGNRVYTKAIKEGVSDYALSKEEKESIEKAINSK